MAAATVARKPSSPPSIEFPIDQGNILFSWSFHAPHLTSRFSSFHTYTIYMDITWFFKSLCYIHALLTCYMYIFDYCLHNICFVIYFKIQMRRSVLSNMRQPQRPSRCASVGYLWAEFVAHYLDAETVGATKHVITKNDYHSSCDRRYRTMFSYLPDPSLVPPFYFFVLLLQPPDTWDLHVYDLNSSDNINIWRNRHLILIAVVADM
jgi:hypothetical protein